MLRNKGFKGPNGSIFDLVYLKKTKNILKSVIEQKLLRIKLSTKSNYDLFAKWPCKGLTGSAPNNFFLSYHKNDQEFLNTSRTKNVCNDNTFLAISNKRGWSLK